MILIRKPWAKQPSEAVGINQAHPLARGLIGAWLPTPSGFSDVTRHRNGTQFVFGAPTLAEGISGGYGHGFTIFDAYRAGASTPALAGAISFAIWLRFPSSTHPYANIVARSAGGGSDWGIFSDNTTRRPCWGYNGAYIHVPTATAPADEWHLWHMSDNGSNTTSWWLDGVPTSESYASTSVPRNAAGDVYFAWRDDLQPGNVGIGRFYLWDRATSEVEALSLLRNEWSLFAPQVRYLPVVAAAPTFNAAWARQRSALTGAGLR